MANISGVNVAGGITPYTTDDTYPSHYAKYGHGGYRTVDTKDELSTIPDERKEEGMVVYVSSEKISYKYNSSTEKFEKLSLNKYVDLSSYYEKTETYSKTEVNKLLKTIDLSSYYTKGEVDDLLENIDVEACKIIEVTSATSITSDYTISPDITEEVDDLKIGQFAFVYKEINEDISGSLFLKIDEGAPIEITNNESEDDLQAGTNISINNNIISVTGLKETYPILDDAKKIRISSNGSLIVTPKRYDSEKKDFVLNNDAIANFSTALGFNCTAESQASNSFVGGDKSTVSHEDCFVFGEGLKTVKSHQTVVGKYNTGLPGWNDKAAFEVGYGNSDSDRKTVFVANTNGYCASIYGFGTGTADFAEYFEWKDGNKSNEDRIGYMVQLNGDKIEFATSFDNCIGVVTGTGGFICDAAPLEWTNRYVKDNWGRVSYVKNQNGEIVPLENPTFDPLQEYKPREQRQEWSPIGMIGKVHIRHDGSLKVGRFATCGTNGIAKDSATTGYRVLKVIDSVSALVLVK